MNANDASSFHLNLLGGFRLTDASGTSITPASRKAQILLAYLAQRAGHPISRGKLSSMLWTGVGDHEARHSLRQCLLVLRKSFDLSTLVSIEQDSISLRPDAITSDTSLLERLVSDAGEAALREAIDLYRGEFLEGIDLTGEPIQDWIIFERRRLAHLLKKGLGLLMAGNPDRPQDEAISVATRLLAIDPQQADVQKTLTRIYGGLPTSLGRRCVVVASADERLRGELVGFLRGRGFEPRACADGADLLLEIGAGEAELALIDLDLPILGGTALLEVLARKRPAIPVVCIGQPEEEIETAGLALGAADFVPTPVDREVLLLRLENVFRQRPPLRTAQ